MKKHKKVPVAITIPNSTSEFMCIQNKITAIKHTGIFRDVSLT